MPIDIRLKQSALIDLKLECLHRFDVGVRERERVLVPWDQFWVAADQLVYARPSEWSRLIKAMTEFPDHDSLLFCISSALQSGWEAQLPGELLFLRWHARPAYVIFITNTCRWFSVSTCHYLSYAHVFVSGVILSSGRLDRGRAATSLCIVCAGQLPVRLWKRGSDWNRQLHHQLMLWYKKLWRRLRLWQEKWDSRLIRLIWCEGIPNSIVKSACDHRHITHWGWWH